tara:strand:- start:2109 stop:3260 length:1152 start_codon:yes stop_codon:yes gene_type:complete
MKKLLIIHNKYRNLGGEDIAVENEIEILKKYYNLEILYFSNEIDNHLSQGMSLLFNKNKDSVRRLENIINKFNPDFAYVHNTWFKASPEIFRTLDKHSIKTLVKLHNFRFDCTNSYFSSKHLKGEKVCRACGMNKKPIGFFNKYYKDSYLKSLIITRYGKKYFKILNNTNLKILTLTNFHKEYLLNIGFNENNIFVHRNYLTTDLNNNYNPESNYIVYSGRISYEKGVEKLLEAYTKIPKPKFKLLIVGNGPEYRFLKKKYESNFINFLGEVSNEESLKIINKSRAVITATNLYEGQPTLLCEASSLGVPSVFPKNGGISEFFDSNYILSFDSRDQEGLISKLKLLDSEDMLKKTSIGNKKFLSEMLSEKNYIENFESILNGK